MKPPPNRNPRRWRGRRTRSAKKDRVRRIAVVIPRCAAKMPAKMLSPAPTLPALPIAPRLVARNDSNRVEPGDRPAHDWYRFILSYPPHLVRQYVESFGLNVKASVLDPFCGTGTSVV